MNRILNQICRQLIRRGRSGSAGIVFTAISDAFGCGCCGRGTCGVAGRGGVAASVVAAVAAGVAAAVAVGGGCSAHTGHVGHGGGGHGGGHGGGGHGGGGHGSGHLAALADFPLPPDLIGECGRELAAVVFGIVLYGGFESAFLGLQLKWYGDFLADV